MLSAEQAGRQVVRLHTGDPCLYGAIREQMDLLDARGVAYDVAPGVSSFCGAAAALKACLLYTSHFHQPVPLHGAELFH